MARAWVRGEKEVYRPLAHRHKWLMQILVSWAEGNRDFKCWPSLRTIAEDAGMKLAATQKCLAEMESLEYFKRTRGSKGAFCYWLSKRFQPPPRKESIPVDSQVRRDKLPNDPRNPQVYAQEESTPVDQRRSQDKDSQFDDSKRGTGLVRRFAPPEEKTPEVRKRIKDQLAAKHVRFLFEFGRRADITAYWQAQIEGGDSYQRMFDDIDRQMREAKWNDRGRRAAA